MQAAKNIENRESPLSADDAKTRHKAIPDWTLLKDKVEREFSFKGFNEAVRFVNAVARVAQELDHHPEIFINYNKVKLELSTHKIGGLSPKDFTLAERIDRLAR